MLSIPLGPLDGETCLRIINQNILLVVANRRNVVFSLLRRLVFFEGFLALPLNR